MFFVTAYNTLKTKPIVKTFCWKNKYHFFRNKSFVYQFSVPTTKSRLFHVHDCSYVHVSSKPISLIKRKIEYLTKALSIYIHETE